MKVIAHHHDIGQTLMTVADGLDLSAIRQLAADRLDIRPSGEPEIAIFAEMVDPGKAPLPADNLFSRVLSEELDRRTDKQRRTDEFLREHAEQVELVHAIFRQSWPELSKMQLRGDYGEPTSVRAEHYNRNRTPEQELDKICHPFGITVSGGAKISPYEFCVAVDRRSTKGPHNFQTRVFIQRHYPFMNEEIYTCHIRLDEAAAQAIMADFFRTMAKYFYIKDNAQ